MKQQRRHHSPEFKREAVALVVEHGYSCAAAGRWSCPEIVDTSKKRDTAQGGVSCHRHAKMVKEEMFRHLKEAADQKEVEKRYGEIQKILPAN